MKLYLKIETGDGEQICEIDQEYFFQAMLARSGLESAVRDFESMFHAIIVSPVRGMIRGKVGQLKERKGYSRIVRPGAPATSHPSFGNTEDQDVYMEKIRCLAAQRIAEAGSMDGDHGAAGSFNGCTRA